MTSNRNPVVTEREMMRHVLNRIWKDGEVMESDLYEYVGNKGRISPLLKDMAGRGLLKVREKEHGKSAKLYSFTEAGEVYCLSVRFSDMIWFDSGSIDMDNEEMPIICNGLRRLFATEDEKE